MSLTLLASAHASSLRILQSRRVGLPCTLVKGVALTDSKAVVLACFAVEGMIVCCFDYCLPMLDIDR